MLGPKVWVVLTPYQENFSLQQAMTITESFNQSQCRIVEHSACTQVSRNIEEEVERLWESEDQEFAVRLWLIGMSEARSYTKAHQHGCPTWAVQQQICQSGQEEAHKFSVLHKLQANEECWKWGKKSSPGKSTIIVYPLPNGQLWRQYK